MLRVFVLSVALLAGSAQADEWTIADTKREAVYLVLHAMDWAQTRTIARNPDTYAEGGIVASRLIGAHPSVTQVNRYMAGSALLVMVASRMLPTEYRHILQYAMIVDSAYSVGNNFRIGVSMKF